MSNKAKEILNDLKWEVTTSDVRKDVLITFTFKDAEEMLSFVELLMTIPR